MNSTENKEVEKNLIIDEVDGADDTEEKVVIKSAHERHSSHSGSSHGHHHSSHGSHKHSKHRHRRKRRKKNKKSIGLFYKIAVVVAIVALIILGLYGISRFEKALSKSEEQNDDQIIIDGDFAVLPPVYDKDVDIIGEVAKFCYELDSDLLIKDTVKGYKSKGGRLDIAEPVVITPKIYNIPESYGFTQYKVEVSENSDMTDSTVLSFAKDEEIEINYLKTNTKYYYKVTLLPGDCGFTGSFKTSDTPRILNVDGIGNVRDIGNWKAENGKRIKQGLLYRGIELEGIVVPDYVLTEKGKNVLLDVLGVKYDFDLRGEYDNPTGVDSLGKDIVHKYYDSVMYKGIFTVDGKKKIKEIFTDLANPENYPMYLHCTYGMDRTGTVCFLLEALLGVSDDDLKKDYELSTLFHYNNNLNNYITMLTALNEYEGDTTQQKVENYLLECGITEEQIESLRTIFLGE